MTPRVRIVQALCPQRHCILAHPYVEDEDEPRGTCEELLREQLDKLLGKRVINPLCAICGAPYASWTYEDRPTRFKTMEEAMPHLKAAEAEQRAAAQFLKASRN